MPLNANKIAYLRGQRQTRSFVPEPVTSEQMDALLEVARWTGSAVNRQPWKFVVVDDRDLLAGLSTAKGGSAWIAEAGAAIVILTEGQSAQDNRFDAGRVAERLLLASNAVGIGGAIVSWSPGYGEEAVRSLLQVPEGLWVYAAVIVGTPNPDAPKAPKKEQPRKPIAEIVVRNGFGS